MLGKWALAGTRPGLLLSEFPASLSGQVRMFPSGRTAGAAKEAGAVDGAAHGLDRGGPTRQGGGGRPLGSAGMVSRLRCHLKLCICQLTSGKHWERPDPPPRAEEVGVLLAVKRDMTPASGRTWPSQGADRRW